MGVLNVTPGLVLRRRAATSTRRGASSTGAELVADGADLVDVGGESTRPGREPAAASPRSSTGCCRWSTALAAEGVAVSVDTMRAAVAEAAVEAGAVLVNDVSGGLRRPRDAAAGGRGSGRRTSLMHWRGALARRCSSTRRTATWSATWSPSSREQLDAAVAAGIAAGPDRGGPGDRLLQDRRRRTGTCCAGTERLHELGHPVLVATSRKRFLGHAARRRGRRACARRGARGRHHGHVGAGGGRGGLVHPRAPGAAHARRGAGGGRWAGGGPVG